MPTTSSPRLSRRTKLGATLLLAAAAIGGVAWSRNTAPAAPAVAAAAVMPLTAPGIVEAEGDRVALGFEASGRIDELLVKEGDVVTAGQILGHLDTRIARARVARAEAAVAVAKARRDATVRGARGDEIRAAAAEADAAAAQAKERGIARDRAEALLAANPDAIPMAEVDTARGLADASAAQARAAASRASLVALGLALRADRRGQGRARRGAGRSGRSAGVPGPARAALAARRRGDPPPARGRRARHDDAADDGADRRRHLAPRAAGRGRRGRRGARSRSASRRGPRRWPTGTSGSPDTSRASSASSGARPSGSTIRGPASTPACSRWW